VRGCNRGEGREGKEERGRKRGEGREGKEERGREGSLFAAQCAAQDVTCQTRSNMSSSLNLWAPLLTKLLVVSGGVAAVLGVAIYRHRLKVIPYSQHF
jgi:hypothetical protein